MPKTCYNYLKKVRPLTAFVKKRDAENHVALLALEKLHKKKFLSKHLFPSNLTTINQQNMQDSFNGL
jgi:hypothetical protein